MIQSIKGLRNTILHFSWIYLHPRKVCPEKKIGIYTYVCMWWTICDIKEQLTFNACIQLHAALFSTAITDLQGTLARDFPPSAIFSSNKIIERSFLEAITQLIPMYCHCQCWPFVCPFHTIPSFKVFTSDKWSRKSRDSLPRLYIGIWWFLSVRHVVDSFTTLKNYSSCIISFVPLCN